MFKEFKKEMVISTIIYVIIGVILIVWPDKTARIVSYIIAGALTVAGAAYIVKYARQDIVTGAKEKCFSIGTILAAAGLLIFFKPSIVINMFPVILGICVLVSGVMKLQNAIDVARTGYSKWWVILTLAVICIILGIVVLANPFETATLLIRIIGAGFVYSGLSDLLTTFFISGKISNFEKDLHAIDADKK